MSDDRERPISWWGAALLVFAAAGGTRLVLAAAAGIKALRWELAYGEAFREVTLDPLALGLAQAAGYGAALWIGLWVYKRDVPITEALRIRPVPGAFVGLSLVAGLALQFPLAELSNLLRELDPLSVPEQLRMRRIVTADGIVDGLATVLAIVLVAPLAEEGLFRGFALPGLQQRHGARFAILWSALLFGASHVDPVTMAYATTAGLLFGIVTVRVGSVLPAFGMHLGVNALPVLLPERVVSIRGFNTIGQQVHHIPLPLLVGSSIVAAAALAALMHLSDQEAG